MITLNLQRGSELIILIIVGSRLTFYGVTGNFMRPLTFKWDWGGIIKEFPDLADKTQAEAEKIAEERLKTKLESFRTEDEVADYVVEELKKYGYESKKRQKAGFRPTK